jgi:hypothetical protein
LEGLLKATTSAAAKAAVAAKNLRLHHYAVLLFAELAFILVYPFFTGSSFREGLFRALASTVFSAALYAILGRGRLTAAAFVIGVPAIALLVLNAVGYLGRLHIVGLALGFGFLAFVDCVFVYTILSEASVTTDTLAGAISAYMLIGITFGVVYALIDRVVPGAFRDTVEPGRSLNQAELTFYSFMTLTSVGYGDIVPRDSHARAFAMIESVIGIMYPAVLVGRLVGLHGQKRENE